MRAFLKSVVARLLAVLLTVSAAFAQDRPAFRQEELDQMLAPIALYPDPLLSQILMASTYPLEVVQAARWSKSRPALNGLAAVQAVEGMDWDPSVKSLAAFPQVLQMMDEKLDWTQRLGEAFLTQEPQVMETIQDLRHKAAAAGNLRSGDQMRVARQGEYIAIEPPGPQVVYVPYYDPTIVYGPWWWPAYPPVYWGPPPGYYVWPAYAPGFWWSSGIVISAGFFFGHFDWHHRHVMVVHVLHRHPVFADRRIVVHRTPVASNASPARWQHDPIHRRGVPFRRAVLRQQFGQPPATRSDANRDLRLHDAARRDDVRVQARGVEPRAAVTAPATHIGAPPAKTIANGNGRRAAAPEQFHRAAARSTSDRGHSSQPATTIRQSAPASRPSAGSGNPAPHLGGGDHRGEGRVGAAGGGRLQRQ